MKHRILISVLGAILCLCVVSDCQSQDISGDLNLRDKLKDVELVGPWFYDDLDGAIAAAAKTKKPLLIVFRCVP